MTNFFFLWGLMPTPGKGLLPMLGELLTPLMLRTISNAQIPCDLDHRFIACFRKLHCLYFELLRKGPLCLLHGLFPLWRMSTSQVSLPHFSGSRPRRESAAVKKSKRAGRCGMV